MEIEDLKFDVIKRKSATEKRPSVVTIEVTSETKKILGVGVPAFGPSKGKLVIFYEEKS